MKIQTLLLSTFLLALALGACSSMGPTGPSATAKLEARSGSRVSGTVQFTQHGDHVLVRAEITGLAPGQEHGFHVHDKGDCSAPDGMSAAGHFNPSAKPHGPQDSAHHGGDMPALKADAYGKAVASFRLEGVTVADGANSVVGRSLIVHKDPDDYKTQPTGNSGARIACGLIVKA